MPMMSGVKPVPLLTVDDQQLDVVERGDDDTGADERGADFVAKTQQRTWTTRWVGAGLFIGAVMLYNIVMRHSSQLTLALPEKSMGKAASESMWAQTAAELLTREDSPRKFVVFRCHSDDYAGGFGDRIAGVYGAAYLALSLGRELKIDWPDLSLIFSENILHWRANYDEMEVSKMDQKILNSTLVKEGFAGYPDKNFKGLSPDVQVLNGWDTGMSIFDDWRGQSNPVDIEAGKTRVLIFSGNRGGSPEWFDTIPNMPKGLEFWELYHAVFEALFVPNPVFMGMSVSLHITGAGRGSYLASFPLGDVMQVLKDPNTFSMAAHIRTGDPVIRAEANMMNPEVECNRIDQPQYYTQRLRCLDQVGGSKAAFSKRVLLVFSDSRCAKKHITDYYAKSTAFTEVWAQDFTGGVNIDSTIAVDEHKTLYEGLRDWTLLKSVDEYAITTAYTFVSGFPSSAIIASSTKKELRELNSCQKMTKKWLCAGRFC
jgi:hypothetical protein